MSVSRMAILAIVAEADRAQARYGPFTSTHEALGVLVEEVDELKQAIRANKMGSVSMEAKQVAAVSARLYQHALRALDGEADGFMDRSGCKT